MENKYVNDTRYFENRACKYYPCHEGIEHINCMFCYCPLYEDEGCGGEYYINDKGIKNCRNCSYPHDIDNYPDMIRKIKDRMYDRS